jgi:6-phosphogluconolactonase (cycloisomerase 2 family)
VHHTRIAALAASSLLALLVAASATASSPSNGPGAVYTLTNSASGNAVAAFSRAADGTLSPQGTYASGGRGTGALLGSQGALVLSGDGRALYAVNAGSDSVSAFAVRPDGLALEATAPSSGTLPISVTTYGRLVYVLNAGGRGSISGFVADHGSLTPIAGSTRPLGAGTAAPAQIQFSPDGSTLAVTEKGSKTIDTYAVGADGRAGAPVTSASAGATPFGFDFDNRGHLLVSEASGSASSYSVGADGSLTVISGAVATHQGAPCWLVASKNGRYAYTANGGSGTISGFAVGHDGSLTLLDASGATADLGAGSHPLDEAISENGRYLYNLTDGRHAISAFRIGEDGSLTALGSVGGLPAGAEGIAAR